MAKAEAPIRGRFLLFGNLIITLLPPYFYSVHPTVTKFRTSLTGEITGTLYFQGWLVIGHSRLLDCFVLGLRQSSAPVCPATAVGSAINTEPEKQRRYLMRDDHLWAAVKITEAAVTQLFNGASTPNEVRRGLQIGEIVAELYTAIYAGIVEADYRVGRIAAADSSDQETQPNAPILESKPPESKPPESKPPESKPPESKPPEPKLPDSKTIAAAQRRRLAAAVPSMTADVESSEVESFEVEFPHLETRGIASVMASYPSASAAEPANGLRQSVPAAEPTENIGEGAPAVEPTANMGESVPAITFSDDIERNRAAIASATGLGESVPAAEPTENIGESILAITFADDMERSRAAIASATSLRESILGVAHGDDMERSRAAIPPLTGLGESVPAVEPANGLGESVPAAELTENMGEGVPAITFADHMEPNRAAIAPATGLGESVPAVEPANDIGETAPAVEPANDMGDSVPAIAPDDVKESEPTQESTFPAVTMGDVLERIGSRRSSASRFFDR